MQHEGELPSPRPHKMAASVLQDGCCRSVWAGILHMFKTLRDAAMAYEHFHIIVDQNAFKTSFEKNLRKYKEKEFKAKHTNSKIV